MRKILAIAQLEIRKAFRSRVMLVLLCILLLAIVGLPLTVKSDGTAGGLVQIVLQYTLGLTGALLSLSTLWVGCAAVAADIEERQIQLIVTKPVTGLQLWTGKWAGLMAVNALLLTVAGVATYFLLMIHVRATGFTASGREQLAKEVLVARKRVRPDPPDIVRQAPKEAQRLQAAGARPSGISDAQWLDSVTRSLFLRARTVAPGAQLSIRLNLPAPAAPGKDLLIAYRFSASQIGPVTVKGLWQISRPDRTSTCVITQETTAGSTHIVSIPPDFAAGASRLDIVYDNLDEQGTTVLFEPQDGLLGLTYQGAFPGNYLRALLVLFAHLGLLAALGVTAGCLFSMPVASFLSLGALLVLAMDHVIQSVATAQGLWSPIKDTGQAPGWAIVAGRAVYKLMYGLVYPLQTPNPLELVSTGLYISWGLVGYALAVKGLVYGGVLAALGVWALRQREMALPA